MGQLKIILNILITIGFVVCEVPPPYPSRGFRPSPPFNLPLQSNFNQRPQPQTTYGTPNAAPSKQVLLSSPQIQYGTPNTRNVESLGIRSNTASNVSPNFNSRPTIPSTSYGIPVTDSSRLQQNNIRTAISQPQTTYGAPNNLNNNLNRPQTQYGAPDTRNVENLEQIRQLNLLLQLRQSSKSTSQNQAGINLSQYQNSNRNVIPTEQYLPIRNAANFRDGFSQSNNVDIKFSQSQNSDRNVQQSSQQYLPAREAENFRREHQLPVVNIPQRQVQIAPGNNFGLSSNKAGPSFQPNNQNIGIPTSQYQPSQSNNFNSNVQNGNNAGQQYVPSIQRPSESKQNNFGATNQNIPQNFASNFNKRLPTSTIANIPQYSNGSPNNIGGANRPSNFDIQPAYVRKLSPSQDNRNSNIASTQAEFAIPNLRPTGPNENFGRSNPQGAERESVDETYLPPTSTARTVHRQLTRPTVPSSRPTEAPVQQDEQSPESDEEEGGPNISIANAVAGAPGGQSFYLLQPDGRLQRVTYQKTREEGDQENEYTANYLFQNIQADPALVYSPLITLGK